MTEIQTGTTGAKRMRFKKGEADPNAVIARLMEEYPTAGEGEITDRLIKEGRSNSELNRAVYEYIVRNTWRAIEDRETRIPPPGRKRRDAPTPREEIEVEETIRNRLAEMVAELCALPMPNGKDLGDCTGKELDQMNKANERLRKIVPANMTVREAIDKKRLTVEQIEALRGAYHPKH